MVGSARVATARSGGLYKLADRQINRAGRLGGVEVICELIEQPNVSVNMIVVDDRGLPVVLMCQRDDTVVVELGALDSVWKLLGEILGLTQ